MAWATYYLFESAAEAQRGRDLLLAEDAARYGVVYLDRTRIDGGERDADGFPVMIDGPGHLLSVLDREQPDPVPGWEQAQVTSDQAGHTWAHGEYAQLAMDEEAPAAPVALVTATRPTRAELIALRELRIDRREANAEVHRLRADLERQRDRVLALNARVQGLPAVRAVVLARIAADAAARAGLVTQRDAAIAVAQDAGQEMETRRSARDERDRLIAEIAALDARLTADRAWRDGYSALLAAEQARRDQAVAVRDALLTMLQTARSERDAAIAALEGR